tara:strand:+ start:3320 stop:6367 length:3048 start_codon:yes stop_codon:yes gene_type:complete
MIQLKPIDENVQKTLLEKIRQSGKDSRPITEPITSAAPSNYLQSRTTWARMISLTVPKGTPNQPVVISAGEEIIDPSRFVKGNLDFTSQVENKLGQAVTVGGETKKINGILRGNFADKYQTNNYNRPMAGLKSISTRIQGNTKAIRQADIKWICWDFETLERLTPHFLAPGVSVALEFGWMWPNHIPEEFIYDNWVKLDARTIGDLNNVLRQKGKGNQEIVYGIVKNFTWQGRDDGGFDCTTEIVSPASSVFGSPLGDSESAAAFEIPAELRNQIRDQRKYFSKRKEEVKDIRDNAAIQESLREVGLSSDGKSGISDTHIQNIPPKILFENLTEILINMKYNFSTYEPGRVATIPGGESKDSNTTILSENPDFKDTIIVQRTYDWFASAGNYEEAYLGPYVSYGWFEDNILNRFVSKIHDGKIGFQIRSVDEVPLAEKDGVKYYESVKIINDTDNLLTLDASEVIIPGQFPFDLEFKTPYGTLDEPNPFATDREIMSALAKKVNELPSFAVNPVESDEPLITNLGLKLDRNRIKRYAKPKKEGEQQKGYLRNLLIHAKVISEEMSRASTVEDGLINLMNRVSNSCGGIWDFQLTADTENPFQLKIIEASSTEEPVSDLLQNKSINLATGEIADGYESDGLMIFPTWQVNSIVYNQNMVTKLPSQMAAAAIYGANFNSSEAASEDLSLDPAARAIGKLFNEGLEKQDNPEDKVLQNMTRVIGNSDHSIFGYNSIPKNVSGKQIVPELNPNNNYEDGVQGVEINVDKIIQIYTEKQIMEILDDGVPHLDPETGKESEGVMDGIGNFFSGIGQFFVENADVLISGMTGGKLRPEQVKGIRTHLEKGPDYRYLYTKAGIMKKHFKNALNYFTKQAPQSIQKQKDILTPIELSVTIDGTGAIFAGEAFSSTYIPGRYREATVFQIMDVSHELDSSGWKTTLRGLMRVDRGFGKEKGKTIADQLKELIPNLKPGESVEPNPPYNSFLEYLEKTKGKKSPYKLGVKKAVTPKTLEQKVKEKE